MTQGKDAAAKPDTPLELDIMVKRFPTDLLERLRTAAKHDGGATTNMGVLTWAATRYDQVLEAMA